MEDQRFRAGDALLIVDVQHDFCPGGALAVPQGDAVVPVLNAWIDEAERAGALIVASRDWHPASHVSFAARGGPWPPHCVQGTAGAAFHPGLALPADATVVSKGNDPDVEAYSAFGGTGLESTLHERGIERVWVGGLARDYCVRASVLDALVSGFAVRVVVAGTRGIAQTDAALEEMAAAGAALDQRSTP